MSDLIESKTRFPGADTAPLDTVGLRLSPKATEELRQFATGPAAMGQGEEKGSDATPKLNTAVATADEGAGGRFMASRPISESEARLLNLLIPRPVVERALRAADELAKGPGWGRVEAFQYAFWYAAESEGWRRHLRGGGR